MNSQRKPKFRERQAFTLIELLVVIAIIALLISVLLPALGKARNVARQLVCSTRIRTMAQAQQTYANNFKDFIAGPNTSGLEGQFLDANGRNPYVFDTTSSTPTTTHDFISPTLGDSLGFSANRALRTWDILQNFSCPHIRDTAVDWNGGGGADLIQFRNVRVTYGWKITSYLSPAAFHYRRQNVPQSLAEYRPADEPSSTRAAVTKYLNPNPATLPTNYIPRLDRVGLQLSNKVIVADGTRYLNTDSSVRFFDFDPTPAPNVYGNFLASGPIYQDSSEYGRGYDSGSRINVKASFRHAGQVINAGYFDGHVGTLKSTEAWENAELWYPSNTEWTGTSATPESAAKYQYLLSRPVGSRGLP
ncbi:MAG: type II secretion system protein [Planctomycetes bacterium]|nr:type II secretion system protein [Planctomycetota bacterium]